MTDRIWFVVERNAGGEFPAIYHDVLPDRLTRKGSTLMVYGMRIDRLPDPDYWLGKTLAEIYAVYRRIKCSGTLPQNMADPPRDKGPGTTRTSPI